MKTFLSVLLVFCVACSTTPGAVMSDGAGSDDSRGAAETAEADDAHGSPETLSNDAADLAFDDATVEPETVSPECQPGDGCFLDPCEENANCLSGWCVEHMGDDVCTQICTEECPPGWNCKKLADADPDVVFVCISDHATLCQPCATPTDCQGIGGAGGACLNYGDQGAFCGGGCEEDDDCPWGFSCTEAETVDGVASNQCVANAGVCPCTPKAVELSLATPCSVTNEFGTCEGKRVCTEAGLTDCDAQIPALETCNGIDDNCDGDVDEPVLEQGKLKELCDDGNDCTEDLCLGEAGCESAALEGDECKDGNPCTIADHCEAGVCVGKQVDCDDENPCTDDACDESGGCVYTPNTAGCDDGDPCTVADQCLNEVCKGVSVNCDCADTADCGALEDGNLCNGTLYCETDGLPYQCAVDEATVVACPEPAGVDAPCLAASCDPQTGACSLVPANDGALCSDGDSCTVGDACADGTCIPGPAANCNDGNLCTDDSCDPDSGCQWVDNELTCNDGDPCTTGDQCSEGVCVPTGELACDDGNVCTDDSCVAGVGCIHEHNQAACDDGNACTTGDHCSAGQCVAEDDLVCNDSNVCTADVCLPGQGCAFEPVDGDCSDGDPCTVGDSCVDGQCVGGGQQDCDDGNVCTDDSCTNGICVHAPNEAVCDDGNACTLSDYCVAGKCEHKALLNCDDENVCTSDSCSPIDGCLHLLNNVPCDDDDLCTTNDKCSLGDCVGTGTLTCNDGNPCTDDSCDPEDGCLFDPNTAACDDGNACTANDVCSNGACKGGASIVCNDANPCTDDTCDLDGGCVFSPNEAECSDGDVCTVGDVCADGVCTAGELLNCDDGSPCTDDSCNAGVGCLHVMNTAPCDDGDACTDGDQCALGQCFGGAPVTCDDGFDCTTDSCDAETGCVFAPDDGACDDGNLCTDDACDPELGCIHVDNDVPCDDGDACTEGDFCANGGCQPGAALQCDDGNECTTDSCDPDSGCVYTPVEDGTTCGQIGWACVAAECSECPNLHGTTTFNYTGGAQSFTVPLCVTKVTVEVWGAQGGGANCCSGPVQDDGGKGGYSKGVLDVQHGDVLSIYVGGKGVTKGAGGWNGGGAGGQYGAGGGGGTDVRLDGTSWNNRVIVGRGGGGGNCGCPDHGYGGYGGGNTGQAGNGGGGGGPGTQTSGGSAGGAFGTGGANGGYHYAGGGGGWYGGGFAYAAGGGGGSGYIGGVSDATTTGNAQAGHGKAVITW